MLWSKNRSRVTRVAISAALCLGLATPVMAGTVYSWRTEDGTLSFADDIKHVPSRYRPEVERKGMQELEGYERFTPAGKTAAGSYAERLGERLSALSKAYRPPVGYVRRVPVASLIVGATRRGDTAAVVPLEQMGSDEPIVIRQVRTKSGSSLSSQHRTIVEQGERVILVRENESSQRNWQGWVPATD